MTDKSEPNSALQKALSVLETIVQDIRPLGVVDIADELNVPRQSAHRIVRQLEQLGLLRKDLSRERYTPGPRLRTLAINTLSSAQSTRGTHSILQQLVDEINETCNIGMLDGNEIIYIDRAECDWPLRVQLRPGSHLPIHCTAIGKLLLANLGAEQREQILRTMDMRRFTKNTITDPQMLEAQLEQIAAQGYSINNQEDAVGLIAIAVPIRDPNGAIVAGLGVHAPEPRYSIAKAINDLPRFQAAAERIGKALLAENESI